MSRHQAAAPRPPQGPRQTVEVTKAELWLLGALGFAVGALWGLGWGLL